MTTETAGSAAQRAETARRYLWLLPLFALAPALAHGFRSPLPWAATQAQFTCDLAPRRCALGQALAWMHFPVGHYQAFAALSSALLAAAVGVYAMACARSALRNSGVGVILLAVLAGSFGTTVMAALNGYLDIPLTLLAAVCLLTPRRFRLAATWAAAVVGVLVHEGYLLIFLPVTLLPMLLDARSPRDLLGPAAIALSAVGTAVLIALNRPLSPAQLQHLASVLQGRVDFAIDDAAILVMGRSLADNLRMIARLTQTPWWWGQALAGVAIILPPGVMFAWAVVGGVRAHVVAKALLLLAGFSPLAMNLIGFDTWRWSALCTPTMLLAAVSAADRYGPLRLRAAPLFAGVALMLAPLPLLMPRPLSHNPHLDPDVSAIMNSTK